ncbi:MAG: glycosyltransferase family 4 protein [Candidatus Krumholzibacteriota bacterium]|nr:glycosyltransferase family 4 protein [Candidatus Krumholzibacteriota bacterium]
MRIVALNWRDLKHPEAGGAEVHLHEILAHLGRWGHDVVEITSGFPGSGRDDEIDGVRIIRGGHWYDANFVLPLIARGYISKNQVDVVLEDINKLPFFMPLYTKVPVVGVIPHLFGTTVFREANWLIGTYVVIMEKLIPGIFKNNRFMVISPSTADDLAARGVDRERIDVVLCGLDHDRYRDLSLERFDRPTIVHLGRLRKYKSVEVAIRAMKTIVKRIPDARLVIIGDGPYRRELEREAANIGLSGAIEFRGYMDPGALVEYLNRAHLLFNPSPKEGWGLTVVEANACGLPVVASDRPGLRDSVIDRATGFLVPYADSDAFAGKALEILEDAALWKEMSDNSLRRVKELTWERCARETENILLGLTDRDQ